MCSIFFGPICTVSKSKVLEVLSAACTFHFGGRDLLVNKLNHLYLRVFQSISGSKSNFWVNEYRQNVQYLGGSRDVSMFFASKLGK